MNNVILNAFFRTPHLLFLETGHSPRSFVLVPLAMYSLPNAQRLLLCCPCLKYLLLVVHDSDHHSPQSRPELLNVLYAVYLSDISRKWRK